VGDAGASVGAVGVGVAAGVVGVNVALALGNDVALAVVVGDGCVASAGNPPLPPQAATVTHANTNNTLRCACARLRHTRGEKLGPHPFTLRGGSAASGFSAGPSRHRSMDASSPSPPSANPRCGRRARARPFYPPPPRSDVKMRNAGAGLVPARRAGAGRGRPQGSPRRTATTWNAAWHGTLRARGEVLLAK
jgi:hypothetical protein